MPDHVANRRPSGQLAGTSRRRGLWLGIVLVPLIAGGLWAWREHSLSRRPNVLLITLDTTRSDRLGCYGYQLASTPTLDALAAEGVLFERAYTPAPLTLPSHTSMFTGLYPPEHGLITNGRGRLDASVPTLAESLQRAGYDTAAFVASFVLHSKFGLERGFDTYDDDMTNTEPTEHGLHRQRDGKRVVDLAVNWLGQPRRKPFFCWVHLYDAHFPYQSHADEFGDEFQDRPYDGEIAYVDRQVRRLIDVIDKEKTLIVVVGDHGESLGEHEEHEHSLTLYNATLRVPWIWSGHGVKPPGRSVSQIVSLVDLAPTVLNVLGQRALPKISGRSLQPALAGQDISGIDAYGMSDDPLFELGCAPLRSLATQEWKYIRSTESELYDLTSDPHELKNLAAEQPERQAELEARLAKLERGMSRRKSADVQLSPQEQRALESLGYLGGQKHDAAVPEDGTPLPDLKRILPLSNRVNKIKETLSERKPQEAETMARDLVAAAPEYVKGQLILAEVLLAESNYEECRQLLEQVLAGNPEEHAALFQLGLIDVVQNRRPDAVWKFQRALELSPLSIGVIYNLALTLLQLGHPAEAERYFEEALDVDPAYVDAHIGIGMALAARQRLEQAAKHYRLALDYDAKSVQAHTNLAVLLLQQQKLQEGGSHLAQAAKLDPDNAETRNNYGTYLMTIGRLDEAVQELSEAVRLKPDHPQAAGRLQQAQALQQRK